MKNARYLQKVGADLYGQPQELFLDVELCNSHPSFISYDLKNIVIHHVYLFDETQTSIVRIEQEKLDRYELEEGTCELIRGGFIELELDEMILAKLQEALIEGIVHSKMAEAITSFQILNPHNDEQWRYPAGDLL